MYGFVRYGDLDLDPMTLMYGLANLYVQKINFVDQGIQGFQI